ncbi:hypothetical protein Tco_0024241, partial [Tanacetum coccineum]
VIPNTSVSRPQLKSNHLEDRVMSNNSQGKKQKVEDHRRKFKFSNNKTSITACNDSLNAKASKAQVDQESQIKMIQVKEMIQDNDLKNSKSKDKGSRSRSQSMNEQSHYKQDKTKNKAKHKRQKSYLQRHR